VRVEDFRADYLASGQAKSFTSNIAYQDGANLGTDTWRDYQLGLPRVWLTPDL